ncbi:MAG: LPS-assembly protein LptD, partial [Bacteroidia bacterium]|nr:LPS-assembly protein LptD [Bacteroidia bacterium]
MLPQPVAKLFIRIILLIIITDSSSFFAFSQVKGDSLSLLANRKDSVVAENDADSPLKSKVKYTANDSMRFDVINQKMYLFGNAEVTYEDLNLKAGYIELDMKKNLVFAQGAKDSLGKDSELPVFTQKSQSFKSHKMTYNFQTKKGRIIEVLTKEADGYIHGETVKKDSSNTVYIRNGKYTTCDLEHPHFYILAKKLKVIPNDVIVTGPANLVINGVPTPLVVPFGFFPNKRGQKSGLLIPTYGESVNMGFFLRDGGFYWGISDKIDMALRGDIYSRGSWGAKTSINYVKRYKYSGNFQLNFSNFKIGEKELPTFSQQKDFIIRWTHTQDVKARPGMTFMASVNAGSSHYNHYNSYNPNVYLNN